MSALHDFVVNTNSAILDQRWQYLGDCASSDLYVSNPERKTNRARVIKAWNEIAGVLISQIDWRKAKKEKIQHIYEECTPEA